MKITNLQNATKVPFDIDGRIMYSSEALEVVHLNMKPNEKLLKHKNPFDVVFYVLSGNGKLIVENNVYQLEANDSIEVSSEYERAWENNSSEDLKLLVIKIFRKNK